MSDEHVDLIITVDRGTGEVIRTLVREPGARPREVVLDVEEVINLISGRGGGEDRLLASRAGPDPRRLPGTL